MKKSCMYALIALTLVAGATLLAACGGGDAVEIHVVLKQDNSVSVTPSEVSSGRVTFLVENGTAEARIFIMFTHDLVYSAAVNTFVRQKAVESASISADSSERISVDLEAGSYVACNQPLVSPDEYPDASCLTFTVR